MSSYGMSPFHLSVISPFIQSISQSFIYSINQLVISLFIQSVSHFFIHSISQSFLYSINQSVISPFIHSITQSSILLFLQSVTYTPFTRVPPSILQLLIHYFDQYMLWNSVSNIYVKHLRRSDLIFILIKMIYDNPVHPIRCLAFFTLQPRTIGFTGLSEPSM